MVMTKDEELKIKANSEGYQIINMPIYKAARKYEKLLLFITLSVAYLAFFVIGLVIGSSVIR
jgi:hypothetical protein